MTTPTPFASTDETTSPDVIAKIGGSEISASGSRDRGLGLPETGLAERAWEIPGCATTFRLDANDFGAMSHLTELRLADDGLLASTVDWIDPGARISLGFEASGQTARRGEVIACRQDGDVHRIAIRFEQRLAA